MKSWWSGLSQRERVLILIAGGLTLLVCLFQFAYQPLTQAHARAETAYKRQAAETYQTLDGLARLKLADEDQPNAQATGESLELLISGTARERNLAIVRLQPAAGGALMVWLDNSDPIIVNRWMYELENRHGLVITALDLRRQPESTALRGSITLSRGGAG